MATFILTLLPYLMKPNEPVDITVMDKLTSEVNKVLDDELEKINIEVVNVE